MATIECRSGNYRALIRKKNRNMSATFSSKEMAEIWSKYQEDLIDAMENFQVKPENYITLEQCLELKIKDLIKEDKHKKTIQDFENISNNFSEIMNVPFGDITTDMIREIISTQFNSVVRKGGSAQNVNSGDFRVISQVTILNRLRYLSAVFGFMIEKGANITNPVQVVVNQVKMSMTKKGIKDEQE